MNLISRYFLLATSLLTPVAPIAASLTLAGCAATSPAGAQTPAQVLADAVALVASVSGLLTEISLADPTAIPPAQVAQIQGDLTAAKTALATLSTLTAAAASASTLAQIDLVINNALSAISGALPMAAAMVPALAAAVPIVDAAIALLPVVEAWVNPYITQVMAARRAPLRATRVMSVPQARAQLGVAAFP